MARKKRNDRLVGASETSKELAQMSWLQRKNLNKTGLPKRERVASVSRSEELAKTLKPPLPKRKETECHCEREPHLGKKKGGIRTGHDEERVNSTVKGGF